MRTTNPVTTFLIIAVATALFATTLLANNFKPGKSLRRQSIHWTPLPIAELAPKAREVEVTQMADAQATANSESVGPPKFFALAANAAGQIFAGTLAAGLVR